MNWLVILDGSTSQLEQLSKVLTGPDFWIKKDGEDFVLVSSEFDDMKSDDEVRERANILLESINGAVRYDTGLPLKIEISDIKYIGVNRQDVSITIDKSLVITYNIEGIPDWQAIGGLSKAAAKFPAVAEVLKFYSRQQLDYGVYYKIYEIIKEDCKKDLVGKGYIRDDSTLDKLTVNLNRPELSGDNARHARYKGETPLKKRLSTKEVDRIMREMVQKWFADKLNMVD